jgi:CRP-like cAMP-binding protein
MEYDLNQRLLDCPDLEGLDETSIAALCRRGQEHILGEGETVYAEGEELDHTFCLLLAGELVVEKAGSPVGVISEQQIFGEIAYFTPLHTRTVTVRVDSTTAVVLKVHLTPAELENPHFLALRKCLGRKTWDRFVGDWQRTA